MKMISLKWNKQIINAISITSVRCKHKENVWSAQKKKKSSTSKALEHFDDFYAQVFTSKWPVIKKGLLGKPKYIAILNNYADPDETSRILECKGAINMRKIFNAEKYFQTESTNQTLEQTLKSEKKIDNDIKIDHSDNSNARHNFSLSSSLKDAELDDTRIVDAKINASSRILHEFIPATKIKGREDYIPESNYFGYYEQTNNFPIVTQKEYDLYFPEHLNIFCYEEDNFAMFPKPKQGSTGTLNYYCLDGGSLLPVLCLGLQPGNSFLDMCSAPGGKTLIALQTLYPKFVMCNDSSVSRTNRIFNVLKQYLYDLDEKWLKPGKIRITCSDGRYIKEENFDRILVDVPCTNDRHSLQEDENNIFRVDRIKERLKLPELQCELLYNALKLVNIGGTVVYSTCSLSPIQNDGVVYMALKKLWEETKIEVIVKDLNPALQQVRNVYKIASPKLMKYGNLILPYSGQNYGPTYFCKLERVK